MQLIIEEHEVELIMYALRSLAKNPQKRCSIEDCNDLIQKISHLEDVEKVINNASIAMTQDHFDESLFWKWDERLRKTLDSTDPFWIRWNFVAKKKGWRKNDE